MNELIKTYTIYLSDGVEALAALVIGLAILQATGQALHSLLARPPQPEQAKVDTRLRQPGMKSASWRRSSCCEHCSIIFWNGKSGPLTRTRGDRGELAARALRGH